MTVLLSFVDFSESFVSFVIKKKADAVASAEYRLVDLRCC